MSKMHRIDNHTGMYPFDGVADAHRILVVDDEYLIRETFQKILASEFSDCKLDVAGDGDEAVCLFKMFHHCVVLMDLHMPKKSGLVAFREIEEFCRNEHREMPSIIFCTGYHPPRIIHDIVNEGSLHALLEKPVDIRTLFGTIGEHLKLHAH